jgi:hypothetical protein
MLKFTYKLYDEIRKPSQCQLTQTNKKNINKINNNVSVLV